MKKLIDVLRNIESFEWSKALFLPADEIWGIDTKCMILDPNDVEDEDDEAPQIALQNGLSYALDVQSYTYPENVVSIKEAIAYNGSNSVPPIEIRVHNGQVLVVDGHYRLEAFASWNMIEYLLK